MTYDEPMVYFCSKLLIFNKLKMILIKNFKSKDNPQIWDKLNENETNENEN